MKPIETQKIIWNKGYKEVTMEDMFRSGRKWDLIASGDKHIIHVCISDEIKNLSDNWQVKENAELLLRVLDMKG